MLKERNGTELPARALSDGTLRFLALTVLEMDAGSGGVICLEEPENGIHPARIPAMLRLLQDIATDVEEPVGAGNCLRQVVINTHSPAVVSEVPDDCLLVAESQAVTVDGGPRPQALFSGLPATWRADAAERPPVVARGKLIDYLNPIPAVADQPGGETPPGTHAGRRRRKVRERDDLQLRLPLEC